MVEWLREHPGLMLSGGLSLVLLVAGVLGAPAVVARLPADFFTREGRATSVWIGVAGWVLVVVGIAMLILPGPGVVVLVVGVVLADFPGKRRFLRWLLGRGRILDGLNRMRARRGKAALERP